MITKDGNYSYTHKGINVDLIYELFKFDTNIKVDSKLFGQIHDQLNKHTGAVNSYIPISDINKPKLKYSSLEYFRSIYCITKCKSAKTKQQDKVYKKYHKYILDIFNFKSIIIKLQDLEILKLLLFNQIQIKAFDFIDRNHLLDRNNPADTRIQDDVANYYSTLNVIEFGTVDYNLLKLLNHSTKFQILREIKKF